VRKGLIISLTLHSAILFFALVSFSFEGDVEPMKDTPIAVDLVTPADVSRIKAGKKEVEKKVAAVETPPEKPKPVEKEAKKEPEKPKRVAPPPPAPKPAEAEPAPKPVEKKAEPKPAPKPVEKKAEPAPAPKPEPKAEPERVAESSAPLPARRPKPPADSRPIQREETKVAAKTPVKKSDFDADQIAALLDKRPDAAQKTPPPKPDDKQVLEPPAPAEGRAEGRDQQMSISEIDALRARISQCWSPPVGGLGSDAIRVKIRMQLKEDGMLAADPQVVNRDGSPFFMAAADSAVRAVMLCQPYTLPDEKYAQWRDMILNFDPREMFGG